jgi:hypothetical protein
MSYPVGSMSLPIASLTEQADEYDEIVSEYAYPLNTNSGRH